MEAGEAVVEVHVMLVVMRIGFGVESLQHYF